MFSQDKDLRKNLLYDEAADTSAVFSDTLDSTFQQTDELYEGHLGERTNLKFFRSFLSTKYGQKGDYSCVILLLCKL